MSDPRRSGRGDDEAAPTVAVFRSVSAAAPDSGGNSSPDPRTQLEHSGDGAPILATFPAMMSYLTARRPAQVP